MSNKVAQWFINKGSYAEGLSLLLEAKPTHNLRRFFAQGEKPTTRRALEYELKKISGVSNTVTQTHATAQPRRISMQEMASVDVSNYPVELKDKYIRKGQLAKKASELRKGVVVISKKGKKIIVSPGYSADEMRERASQILACMDENQKIWDELRYFERFGKMVEKPSPPKVDIDNLNTADLIKLAKNLPPWLTKEKKKIEACGDEKRQAERQKHYDEKKELLTAVREKLNTL